MVCLLTLLGSDFGQYQLYESFVLRVSKVIYNDTYICYKFKAEGKIYNSNDNNNAITAMLNLRYSTVSLISRIPIIDGVKLPPPPTRLFFDSVKLWPKSMIDKSAWWLRMGSRYL